MTRAFEIFNKLAGSWNISRAFPRSPFMPAGFMHGRAVFFPVNIYRLDYEETGKMILENNETPYDFSRKYVYTCSDSKITIYYEGMSGIYQELNLSNGNQCEADHQCSLDRYHGSYDFSGIDQGRFQISYQIKGPKKNHIITTLFTKSSE